MIVHVTLVTGTSYSLFKIDYTIDNTNYILSVANITRANLISGLDVTVPDNAVKIKITATNGSCAGFNKILDIEKYGITTTTTTTTTAPPTTTTTTTTSTTTTTTTTSTTTTTLPPVPTLQTSWYKSDGEPPAPLPGEEAEGWGPSGFVSYYTNAAHTASTTKTFLGARYHFGEYHPATCNSFTHYGIINTDGVSPC